MNEKRKNNNDKKDFCRDSGICGSCLDPDSAGTGIVCSRWQGKNGGSHKPAGKTTDTKKGKTFTLKSKVTVTGKASKKVTYKTSNKKIATVNAKVRSQRRKKEPLRSM